MATFERAVMRNLECPICYSLLTQPKQLLCGHTFCEACLTSSLPSTQARSISCPVCRHDTALVDGGVSSLPTNFPVKGIVSDVTSSAQHCSNCDSGQKADYYCSNCEQYFCNGCHEIHSKLKLNASHVVVSADAMKHGKDMKYVPRRRVLCQEHKPGEGEYQCTDVCITCKKFICMRCSTLTHGKKGHNVTSVDEYKESYSRAADSLRVEAEAKISSVVRHVDLIEAERRKSVNHIDEQSRKNDTTYNKEIKRLTEEKQAFDRKCNTEKEGVCRKFDEMQIKDERFVERLINANSLVINSGQTPLEVNTVAIREALCDQLRQVLCENDPLSESVLEVSRQAGNLKFEQSHELPGLRLGDVQYSECKANVAFSTPSSMCCMAATPDGRMAVGGIDGECGIEIYSADGQLQQRVLKGVQVCGIAFLSDGRCAVRGKCNDNDEMLNVSLYTQEWEEDDARFETLSLDEGGLGGTTVDSDDRIYVGYSIAEKIQVFTTEGGEPVREIACATFEPMQMFAMKTSNIMVVKTHDNTASTMDASGVQMIELKDVIKPQQFSVHPAACMDDTIIIATVNKEWDRVTIERYTSELQRVATLITDHVIQKPNRRWYYLQEFTSGEIAFCTPDRLYIFS